MNALKILTHLSLFGLLTILDSCSSYKNVMKKGWNSEHFEVQSASPQMNVRKGRVYYPYVFTLNARHDYFRTGAHVRWKDEYVGNFHCYKDSSNALLKIGDLDFHCAERKEVNTRNITGKMVSIDLANEDSILLKSQVLIPPRFVLNFGDTIGIGDTIFWNRDVSNPKAKVSIQFAKGESWHAVYVKDKGYLKIKKRMLRQFDGANDIAIDMIRTKNIFLGFSGQSDEKPFVIFYSEQAGSVVDLKQKKAD